MAVPLLNDIIHIFIIFSLFRHIENVNIFRKKETQQICHKVYINWKAISLLVMEEVGREDMLKELPVKCVYERHHAATHTVFYMGWEVIIIYEKVLLHNCHSHSPLFNTVKSRLLGDKVSKYIPVPWSLKSLKCTVFCFVLRIQARITLVAFMEQVIYLIGNILHNHLMARINLIIMSCGPIQCDHCLIPQASFLFALHQKWPDNQTI